MLYVLWSRVNHPSRITGQRWALRPSMNHDRATYVIKVGAVGWQQWWFTWDEVQKFLQEKMNHDQ